MNWQLPIGAQLDEKGVRFRVWAGDTQRVEVVLMDKAGHETTSYALNRDDVGYFVGYFEGIEAGTRYMYRLDGDKLRYDPASRYQPAGVHGPSEIVAPDFDWHDGDWQGLPLEDMVLYEVHIGTATEAGTFDAFIQKLDYLKSLGVTAIELMPVGDFPGERNWGYDGVCLFAPARAYGGPQGYKRLVDAAQARGLAIVQDVVYNHLGPDGNYLRDFSHEYFTTDKKTPWGDALNFGCEAVREFFVSNALYWVHEYHVDGLRLDATHAILDDRPEHFLAELPRRIRETLPPERHLIIFAEDERNEVRLLQPASKGGMGLDAVWADDFHHEARSAFAGDNEGYYADFSGNAEDLAATLSKGWFYTGQRSQFAGHGRGSDASSIEPPHFVYCIQNHDQIGNRALGERLNCDIGLDAYRAASALLLLSPYTPLLFQGQEWAASTPFLFFTDHNEELGRLITEGRRAEFAFFSSFSGTTVPDPQALSTFEASKLKWEELESGEHAQMLAFYRDLLALRRDEPLLRQRQHDTFQAARVAEDAIVMRYQATGSAEALLVIVNLKGNLKLTFAEQEVTGPPANRLWRLLLSTDDPRYAGTGSEAISFSESGLTASSPVAVVLRSS